MPIPHGISEDEAYVEDLLDEDTLVRITNLCIDEILNDEVNTYDLCPIHTKQPTLVKHSLI